MARSLDDCGRTSRDAIRRGRLYCPPAVGGGACGERQRMLARTTVGGGEEDGIRNRSPEPRLGRTEAGSPSALAGLIYLHTRNPDSPPAPDRVLNSYLNHHHLCLAPFMLSSSRSLHSSRIALASSTT